MKVLTAAEVRQVVDDIRRRGLTSDSCRTTLAIIRLTTGAGLRASEISALTLDDVRLGANPTILIRNGKGSKARTVPVMDLGALDDLRAHHALRASQGATGSDLFIVGSTGRAIDRRNIRLRFKSACRCLGEARRAEVTTHHGRHTAISHLLHAKVDIQTVRAFAGHESLATTSKYSHLVANAPLLNLYG
jgi:site-specific recombinase XerC